MLTSIKSTPMLHYIVLLHDVSCLVEETSDYVAARTKLQEAAEKYNYAPALKEYGDYLYFGMGAPVDEPGAVKFYQQERRRSWQGEIKGNLLISQFSALKDSISQVIMIDLMPFRELVECSAKDIGERLLK
jgi:hypothetical protein